ncbi:MAG: hypothetical protein CMN75_02100 [Spirochaeta sp.]|nr:hypothetical protein [Spirochaeta sp.]
MLPAAVAIAILLSPVVVVVVFPTNAQILATIAANAMAAVAQWIPIPGYHQGRPWHWFAIPGATGNDGYRTWIVVRVSPGSTEEETEKRSDTTRARSLDKYDCI